MSLPQPTSPPLSPDVPLPEPSPTAPPGAGGPPGHQARDFTAELERLLVAYFKRQRFLPLIAARVLLCGLLDFPIVMFNNLATIPGALCGAIGLRRLGRWFQDPSGRRRALARVLPPYRTVEVRWKVRAFDRMVIRPLHQRFPDLVAGLDRRRIEANLQEILPAWEKVPTFLEAILTPICWLAGITFLGLDPKTVFYLARDKILYQQYTLWGRSWLVRVGYRIAWLFDDSVPWEYSLQFIGVGLVAYLALSLVIEYVSVKYFYRRGAARRLLANVLAARPAA
ncbi:MAG: hypothetical protein HYY54_07775 [candidate division NC10 bacterium]|nr:hypothetical protein [candidate division NC10 bacterium]